MLRGQILEIEACVMCASLVASTTEHASYMQGMRDASLPKCTCSAQS